MKRLILIIFLLNLILVSAQIKLSLLKQNYSPGETFQAEIILEKSPVKELTGNDILLNNNKISPILLQINKNHYFVYFNLPYLQQGNHSFSVNLLYNIDNSLKEITETKIFIVDNNTEIVTIKPGVILINKNEKDPFYKIFVQSQDSFEVSISESEEFIYSSRDTLTTSESSYFFLYTITDKITKDKTSLFLNYDNKSYEIPIFVKEEIIEEQPEKTIGFITDLSYLNRTINQDEVISGTITLKNYLNKSLSNIKFSLTGNLKKIIKINETSFDKLDAFQSRDQYLIINQNKNALGYYEGNLIATSGNYKAEFPIYITIKEKETIEEEFIEEPEEFIEEEEEPLEEVTEEEFEISFFNISSEEEIIEEKKVSGIKVYIVVILIIIILLYIYNKIRKKKVKTFDDYLSSIKK